MDSYAEEGEVASSFLFFSFLFPPDGNSVCGLVLEPYLTALHYLHYTTLLVTIILDWMVIQQAKALAGILELWIGLLYSGVDISGCFFFFRYTLQSCIMQRHTALDLSQSFYITCINFSYKSTTSN